MPLSLNGHSEAEWQLSLSLDPCQGLASAALSVPGNGLSRALGLHDLGPLPLTAAPRALQLLMLVSPWVLTLTPLTSSPSTLNTVSVPAKPSFLCCPAQLSSLLPAERPCLTSNTKLLVVPKTCSSCVPLHLAGWQLCPSGLLSPQLLSFLFLSGNPFEGLVVWSSG